MARGGQLMGPENGVPASWTAHMLQGGEGEERQAKRAGAARSNKKARYEHGGLTRKTFAHPNYPLNSSMAPVAAIIDSVRAGRQMPLPAIQSHPSRGPIVSRPSVKAELIRRTQWGLPPDNSPPAHPQEVLQKEALARRDAWWMTRLAKW